MKLQTPYGEEGELRFAYGWRNKRAFCESVRQQIADELIQYELGDLDDLTENVIPANVRHGFGLEVPEGHRWLSRYSDGFIITSARKHRMLPPFFVINDQDGIHLMIGRPITYVVDH